jgi:Plasmid pRiA4b ORF-3-like protein
MDAASDSVNEIATVRIELRHTDPLIWRQVEVPTSITLKVLHDIIQAVRGGLTTISGSSPLANKNMACRWTRTGGASLMASKVRLRDVLQPRKTVLDYTYDFGDQ